MRKKQIYLKKKQVTRIIWLVVLFVLIATSSGWSQYGLRPQDTLSVENVSGQPGDTAVWVPISLRNSISASMFTLQLTFDPNLITPKTVVVGSDTIINAWPTGRDTFFVTSTNTYKIFQGATRDSLLTLITASVDSSVYYDTIAIGRGPILRIQFAVSSGITRDTSTTIRFLDDASGTYNIFTHIFDPYKPTEINGTFSITSGGPPGNHAPVFGALANQFSINEGQNLSFVVEASDQDGDTVTLSADALPINATFPTVKADSMVSQTFSFTPDFSQGPGTFSVTFRAKDQKGVSTLKTVTISVNAIPQDLLTVLKNSGGVPGSKGKLVPLILTNLQDVYGVQFTLHHDSLSVKVDSFVQAPRIACF